MLRFNLSNHPTTFSEESKMPVNKPKRLSLVEQVTSEIEVLIQQNHWKIGQKLPPEKDLMEQFDVSRNTLREAIRALVHVGLLTTKQGSGTVVTSASTFEAVLSEHIAQQSLLQILEVRIALETEAAYLAAERRTEDDIHKMETIVEACQEAYDTNNKERFLEADFALHQVIVEASDNSILIDLYASLNDSLYYSIAQNIIGFDTDKNEIGVHHPLFLAIKKQEAHKASRIVKDYLSTMKQQIIRTTEER